MTTEELREHERYMMDVTSVWDYLIHDAELDEWPDELRGLEIVWPDGRIETPPVTEGAWRILMERIHGQDDETDPVMLFTVERWREITISPTEARPDA